MNTNFWVDNKHGYIYVVVRKNLPLEQQLVQSCHASIEASRHYLSKAEEHPSVIVLVVKSEEKLKQIIQKLSQIQIRFQEFKEPDMGNSLTAIATCPLYNDERNFFKKFQLFRGQ